jgi:hypothetical protein
VITIKTRRRINVTPFSSKTPFEKRITKIHKKSTSCPN